MTKLMLAVSSDQADPTTLGAALAAPDLRTALAAAGATRLQVNVDDESVAPAMRIPTGDVPITAVVSLWTDGDPTPLVGALREALPSATVAGWEVEEHRRIEPPVVPDGERADALANVALLRRPAELSVEEWRHNWLVDHTPVAMATQATFGYVQNVVVRAVTDDAPDVAALVEELFVMAGMHDMHAFYGSGGSDQELNDRITRLMASCARFGADRDLDLVPSSRFVWSL